MKGTVWVNEQKWSEVGGCGLIWDSVSVDCVDWAKLEWGMTVATDS